MPADPALLARQHRVRFDNRRRVHLVRLGSIELDVTHFDPLHNAQRHFINGKPDIRMEVGVRRPCCFIQVATDPIELIWIVNQTLG